MNRIIRWLGVGFVAILEWTASAQHQAFVGAEPMDIRTGVFRGQTVTYQVIDGLDAVREEMTVLVHELTEVFFRGAASYVLREQLIQRLDHVANRS